MFLRLQCLFLWSRSSFTQVIYFDFDYDKLIISQDILGFLRKIPIIHFFRSLNYEVTHLFIVGDYFDLTVTEGGLKVKTVRFILLFIKLLKIKRMSIYALSIA